MKAQLLLLLLLPWAAHGRRKSERRQEKESRVTRFWDWEDYPNPQLRPRECGNKRVGWVCDPNHLLRPEEKAQLNAAIRRLRKRTRCLCADRSACGKDGGVAAGVAIVPHMALPRGLSRAEKTKYARRFAENLREEWGFGACDDNILVFLSLNDRKLWTDVGEPVARRLNRERLEKMYLEHRAPFANGDFGEGLESLVGAYSEELEREERDGIGGWAIFLAICCFLLLCCCCCCCIYGLKCGAKLCPCVDSCKPDPPLKRHPDTIKVKPAKERGTEMEPLPRPLPSPDVHFERRKAKDEEATPPLHRSRTPVSEHWSTAHSDEEEETLHKPAKPHAGAGGDF